MTDELEKLLEQLQKNNQQMQAIMLQKQALMIQNNEIEKALEELEKCEDNVYKSIGPILVKTSKTAMKKELADTKEENDIKLKAIERQETRLKERIKESQERFQDMMKTSPHGEALGG
jgi:prefoldin beta subunit